MNHLKNILQGTEGKKLVGLIVACLLVSHLSKAQTNTQYWFLRVIPVYESNECNSTLLGSVTASFSDASTTVSVNGVKVNDIGPEIWLKGKGPTSGNFTISVSTGCASGGRGIILTCSKFENYTCSTADGFSSGGQFDIGFMTGTLVFYPTLQLEFDLTNQCNGIIGLSDHCNFGLVGSYIWEVTDDEFDPSKTKIIKTTSYNTTVTADDLESFNFSTRYGNRWLRVRDSGLPGRDSKWLKLPGNTNFVPKPTASITAIDPNCHDGKGSMSVYITSADPSYFNNFIVKLYNPSLPTGSPPILQFPSVPGSTAFPIDNLATMQYRVEVVNNAPGACLVSQVKTINNPTPVAMTFSTSSFNNYPISCKGKSDGSITVNPSGGAGGYKNYLWGNGRTSQTISGLSENTYSVSFTDSKNCSASDSKSIAPPIALSATLKTTTSYGGYPVQCWNSSNGTILANGENGVGGYSYTWSTGVSGDALLNASANIPYIVTVMDANKCTATNSITLAAPLPIDFTIDKITGLACAGDATASFNASGISNVIPSGSAVYSWSGGGESTQGITSKRAGTYALTISDGQGCSTTKSISIADPPAHTVTISALSNFNGTYIKCHGDSTGALAAEVKDPSGTVVSAENYLWTKDDANLAQGPLVKSQSNLEKGNYKVVITYNTICKTEASFPLNEPESVVATITPIPKFFNKMPISCSDSTDATLSASATGGNVSPTTPYIYVWNYNLTSGSLLAGVGAGDYQVTVKDNNECIGIQTITLDNPLPVVASITKVSNFSNYGISCFGANDGRITAVGKGGTGNFTYKWSNDETTPVISGLTSGSYTVTVRDDNGCENSMEQDIVSPDVLSLKIAGKKDISCFNGKDGLIELQPLGGAGSFQFSNDKGATWQGSNVFGLLTPGPYLFRVKDGNDCSTPDTESLLTQPTLIDIAFTDIKPAFCSKSIGTATAIVTGGTGAFTYSWQNANAFEVDTDEILSYVNGGVYRVTVHDENNCIMTGSQSIATTDGPQFTYLSQDTKCFDSADGSSLITITSGNGPFKLAWPDGQTDLQRIKLKKGQYNVSITDVNLCTTAQAVMVAGPEAIQVHVKSSVVPTCNGSCDGQLTLEATGGVGSYGYEWNSQTSAVQTNLCARTYPLVVKDGNGCTLEQKIELKQPDPIVISLVKETRATCKDGCDGALEIVAVGGNGSYQYTWAAGGSGVIKNKLCPGSYKISVVDQKGCAGQNDMTLNNTPKLPLDLGGGVTLCVGQTYSLDAGAKWARVNWSSNTGFASTDRKVTIKLPGSYWLSAFNDKGCIAQDTFLLETSYDLLKASFMIPQQAVVGDTVVMIDISWPLPESIEWTYPLEMKKVLDLSDVLFGQFNTVGLYEVGLTAHLGQCVDQVGKTITIVDEGNTAPGGRLGYQEYVKAFTLYPSPNDGTFDVGVELIEESPISVSVWNSTKGALINHVSAKGESKYKLSFNLSPLSSGVYVVRLDHAKGKMYVRFIVY